MTIYYYNNGCLDPSTYLNPIPSVETVPLDLVRESSWPKCARRCTPNPPEFQWGWKTGLNREDIMGNHAIIWKIMGKPWVNCCRSISSQMVFPPFSVWGRSPSGFGNQKKLAKMWSLFGQDPTVDSPPTVGCFLKNKKLKVRKNDFAFSLVFMKNLKAANAEVS